MKTRQDIDDIETFFDTGCSIEDKPKTGTGNDRASSRAGTMSATGPERRNTPSTRNLVEHITKAQAKESIAIREAVGDRWLELFRDLAPELDAAVDNVGRHVPCPMHGGRDGFRLFKDSDVTGGGVCNTCGFFPFGTRLLAAVKGWSIDETLLNMRNWLIDQTPGEDDFDESEEDGFDPSVEDGFDPSEEDGFDPSEEDGFDPSEEDGFDLSEEDGFDPSEDEGFDAHE